MNEDELLPGLLRSQSKHSQRREPTPPGSKILEDQIKTTQDAIKEIGGQISLIPKRVYFQQAQQAFNLITGNNRSRSNNQTIKRASPYLTPREADHLQQTKDQIRMKIILQNSRLKTSIDNLRQDIRYYQENERKIIEILRESKTKISDYKQKLKTKSKKISELTDNNIALKGQISQLQDKIANMISYSEWQTKQLQELKLQMNAQVVSYNERIEKLQSLVKTYQQGLANTGSDSHHFIEYLNNSPHQVLSTETISEGTPYSIKEMEAKDIESIKYRNFQEEQLNELREDNLHLKARIRQLQIEMDQLRSESQLREMGAVVDQEELRRRQGELREERSQMIQRSLSMSQQISQKASSIENLQRELMQIRQYIKQAEEKFINSQEGYRIEIIKLNAIIEEKNGLLAKQSDRLKEIQEYYKSYGQEVNKSMQEEHYMARARIEKYEQDMKKLSEDIQASEAEVRRLTALNNQLRQFKDQYEQKMHQASNYIQQREQYQQINNKLSEDLEYYKKQAEGNMEYFQGQLIEANNRVIELEREKGELHDLMARYAAEIRELKNQVVELNREKNDSLSSHEEIPQVKEQPSEEVIIQLNSQTSLINANDLKKRLDQDEQIIPIFESRPLDEQQELEQASVENLQDKDAIIQRLNKQLINLRIEYLALKEETNKFTTEVVEANFTLQKEKEQQEELKAQIISKEEDILNKDKQLQEKQESLARSQRLIQQKEQLLGKVETVVQQNTKQIQRLKSVITKLEQGLKEQQTNNQEMQRQIAKLKLKRLQLQDQLQKMRQQRAKEYACRNELQNSLQLQLNRKREIQTQLVSSKILVQAVQTQKQTEKAMAQFLASELERYQSIQKELQEKIKILNSQKNKLHQEVIARMTEKDLFNQQYSQLQSQVEELKHYRREQLDQIEVLKRSTCEIQVVQSSLQSERDELLRKIKAKDQELKSKTQQIDTLTSNLNKSNIKIAELQQFQRRTKAQIEQNLAILSNIINQQKNQIQKLNFEKEQLINHKQLHIHSISQLKTDKKKLEQLSQGLEKKLHHETKSNTELKIEINKLQDHVDEHMEQNKELKDKIAVCQGEIRRLKLENDAAHKEKEFLLKANQQLKQELQINEKMIKDLSIHITGPKQSLDLSQSQHEEQNHLKQSIHKSNEDSISLKLEEQQSKSGGNLKLQISQIQIRHRSVVQQYQHRIRSTSVKLQQITREKQSKIAQLQAANNNLRTEINEANHAKENLQTTIKHLNKVISDNQAQLERLKGQLTEERGILSSKDLVISSLEKNIAIKNEEIEQKSRTLHDLQEKLQILNSEIETQRKKQQALQMKLADITKQQQQMKRTLQAEIVQLSDDLQISRKILQQAEEDHQLKANKLSKEITSYKMMLEQNQKENSFQLEQSNRSISEINSKLKEYMQTIKQKDTQLKEIKENSNQIKEQYQKAKIISSRFEEEKVQWEEFRTRFVNRQNQLQQEVRITKNQLNSLKAMINQISSQLQKSNNDLNNTRSIVQQLQLSKQTLAKQKALVQDNIEKIQFQKLRVQSRLQTIALERMQFQTQCEQLQQQNNRLQKRTIEQSQETQISTMRLVQERKELQQKNADLTQQIQILRQDMKRMQKEHQTRMEDLSLEKRQNLLDVQQKHEQEIQHHLQEIQQCRVSMENLKEREKNIIEEKENLAKKLKHTQKLLKDSENYIGELTDKILELTQQNNESNAIIQDLRNSLVDKGNQIQECRQAIARLQQELQQMRSQRSPINSSGSIPLSIQNEQKLNDANQFIERLTERNKELEFQLKEKIRIEKELNDRIQKMKERQTRERNSSCDSFPTRSKIFDEKSQNLVTELQQVKIKLSEAEAYIHLLEEENKHPNQADGGEDGDNLKQRIVELQKQVQNLKMVNEEQQAYISQLQNNSNLVSSIRSRRSAIPSQKAQPISKVSYGQDVNQKMDVNFNQKIYLLISFIENYTQDNKSRDKQEQLKSQLSHPVLEQLLSTIFYQLQKSSGIIKDNKRVISDLHEDYDSLVDDLHNEKESNRYLKNKYNQLEVHFKEYQKNCEELLTNKMTLEADIAECKSYIEQLQTNLKRYQRGKEQPKKEGLQILEEQDESSSDSMMSESADSEMPSSVSQSKEFKSSMDIRAKSKLNASRRSVMRTKSNNFSQDKATNAQFLKKCLLMINELQTEVERIQAELQQKNKMLNQHLHESASKDEIINKLSMVQSKIKMNDREMKNHFETSEMQVAAIIKDLLKYRQDKDQYGLQNQSRKKIDEYLNLLQQQLQKSSKFYEQEGFKMQQNSRKNDSPIRLGGSLHEIKQDAVNEDKGSSIVSPRNGQVLRSFSNSQGVTESLDINDVKQKYSQTLHQLHELQEDLSSKDQIIKNMQQKYRLIQQEIFMMLDDIRISFEDDQYLNDQIDKIKKFMSKFIREESQLSKIKESQDKIEEEKANILVESHQKNISNLQASKKNQNPFEQLLKLNEAKLAQVAESISNQSLKEIYRRIQQIMNERFDDCLDFLNTEKSLIADILKIRNDEAYLQSTMNKLASKLTKQQITDIITNSHNRMQANKTLTFILKEDDAKSMVSDQHDFSPNGNKIQQIRNRVYNRPTELSLSMHNQLLEILAAPTRHEFYELIEQFYKILKDFEDRFQAQLSEKDERSEKHSIRIKRVLEGPRQELQFSRQLVNHLQVKHQKNRSSSYNVNMPQDENP